MASMHVNKNKDAFIFFSQQTLIRLRLIRYKLQTQKLQRRTAWSRPWDQGKHSPYSREELQWCKNLTFLWIKVKGIRVNVFAGVMQLSVYLSSDLVCLPVCLSACLLVCLSACLPVCLSACLLVCLSACLPVCLSACLLVCLSVCLYTYHGHGFWLQNSSWTQYCHVRHVDKEIEHNHQRDTAYYCTRHISVEERDLSLK